MRILDAITPLLVESRLFDDPNVPGALTRKPEKNKRKKNATHQGVKVGQGGTLDPLADGVLGESGSWASTVGQVPWLVSICDS